MMPDLCVACSTKLVVANRTAGFMSTAVHNNGILASGLFRLTCAPHVAFVMYCGWTTGDVISHFIFPYSFQPLSFYIPVGKLVMTPGFFIVIKITYTEIKARKPELQ